MEKYDVSDLKEGKKEAIIFCLILLLYALPMAVLFTWSSMNELLGTAFKIIAFVCFIAYSVLGAFLFNLLDQRGALPC